MKFVYLFFATTLFLSACGPSARDAAAYNDEIIIMDIRIVNRMEKLLLTYRDYNPDSMEKAHHEALTEVKMAQEYLHAMEPFSEKSNYKNEALALFDVYEEVLKNEHRRMIDLYCIPEEHYGATERDEWIALSEAAERKVKKASNLFIIAQNDFAKQNNLTLRDSIPQNVD